MPYRFDEQSQKVVSDSSTANTKTDLKAQKAPKSSQGNLAPAGVSQSKQGLASASMEKSRRRTLGQAMIQPDLRPILKKGLIIIGASIVALAGVIYVTSQQHKFGQIKSGGAAQESSQSVNFPAGKKITPLVMSQSIARLAAKARDDGDNEAAVALYARAAEEARLGGPALNKQYIDALSSQAEIYQFSLAQSDKAKPLFEKVLKAQTADSSTRPKKLASTYNNLA
ncbi:MAG: hypothetical protein JSS86_23465, partial [Cyanobacteria bacterium SZAS LIN-2]|nr:hypothetical protein [Cyanobacteria bacterium SZAS LIN-2]